MYPTELLNNPEDYLGVPTEIQGVLVLKDIKRWYIADNYQSDLSQVIYIAPSEQARRNPDGSISLVAEAAIYGGVHFDPGERGSIRIRGTLKKSDSFSNPVL